MTMPQASATDRPAEDEPLDCPVLQVSPEVYAEFLAMLEAPPNPNERLLKSLRTAAPWEAEKSATM